MKKLLAVVLSISILFASEGPLVAQSLSALGKASRGVSRATNATRQVTRVTAPTNFVLKSSQNALSTSSAVLPSLSIPTSRYNVRPPLLPTETALPLQPVIERKIKTAALKQNLSFEQILYRVNKGETAFLADAILNIQQPIQRTQLLRSAFVTVAANGGASAAQLQEARAFWRLDLLKNQIALDALPTFNTESIDKVLSVVKVLEDTAALALLGTSDDLLLVQKVFEQTRTTPLAPVTAALFARGLLRVGDTAALENLFAKTEGEFSSLQNGIIAYTQETTTPLNSALSSTEPRILPAQLTKSLQAWGPVLSSATDPSLQATRQWMAWAKNTSKDVAPQAITSHPTQARLEVPSLAPENFSAAVAETAQLDGVLQAGAVALPNVAATETALTATAEAGQTTEVSVSSNNPLFKLLKKGENPPPPDNISGNIAPSDLPPQDTLLAKLQRAALYTASFVMGLEVATPVIANFGTSFGLSLEDNILVSAATYIPYSLGALLSNWTKKLLGRRGSMNLGLAMMGTGFLGGVTWIGLDGSFVPDADTLSQFYKALGCITLASTGGVFIHNSVGPIMTELNAGASELVRQRRSATTEFSRALGMAASFAFPFLATKVLGMDWSLTFALPIPLVLASFLGTTLIRLPNTKPLAKLHEATHTVQKGLWQKIKNNEYIRLFREEKGAAALLGGLAIMNGVEMSINNGFLFLLPSLTTDSSSQYLFGLAQFAAPFILGRYLAKHFLKWFPNRNMTVSSLISAASAGIAAFVPGVAENPYLLTSALFAAETGISTLFTLSFARTAKNPATVDRLTTMIVASSLACAVAPMMLSSLTQSLVNAGVFNAPSATVAAMIGIPALLTFFTSRLFKKVEQTGTQTASSISKLMSFIKNSLYHPKQRRKRS